MLKWSVSITCQLYGISAQTCSGVVKCWLFSQATFRLSAVSFNFDLFVENVFLHGRAYSGVNKN